MIRWNSVRLKNFIQLLSDTARLEPLLIQGISWESVLFNLAVVNLRILIFGDLMGSMHSRQAQKKFKYSEDRLNQQI